MSAAVSHQRANSLAAGCKKIRKGSSHKINQIWILDTSEVEEFSLIWLIALTGSMNKTNEQTKSTQSQNPDSSTPGYDAC